jgi:tyrosyl-tRNA synthetase
VDEVRQIIEALKEYRAELVHKNYPMGKINELIIKWEDWLNTPQEERFRQRALAEEQALIEYSERARYEEARASKINENVPPDFTKQDQMSDKSVSELLQEGFEEEQRAQQEESHSQNI